jgi:hypothetical protein
VFREIIKWLTESKEILKTQAFERTRTEIVPEV